MPEFVLFNSKEKREPREIADFLRQVADKLEQGSEITLAQGTEQVTIDPKGNTEMQLKVKDKVTKQQLAIKIKWPVGAAAEQAQIKTVID